MNEQTFLKFKIPFVEVVQSVWKLHQLILLKMKSYGYKIKPNIVFFDTKLSSDVSFIKQVYKEVMDENNIESIKTAFLEDEQCCLIEVKNKV